MDITQQELNKRRGAIGTPCTLNGRKAFIRGDLHFDDPTPSVYADRAKVATISIHDLIEISLSWEEVYHILIVDNGKFLEKE